MQLKLTWNTTKDFLLFDIINKDLAVWFVEQSQQFGNNYTLGDQIIDSLVQPTSTERLINEEIVYIDTVNDILTRLKLPIFNKPNDWYDQKNLNTLHKDWADTRYKIPKLTELLYKIDKKFFDAYQEMNCHIHLIERSFQFGFRDSHHWRIDNPFKNNKHDWEVSHLHIKYPGHGRCAFEKFQWLDIDDVDMWKDNNNWDNIDSFLGMNLVRPYKLRAPEEFLVWCKEKNLVPHGYDIPLANLTDWKNKLTDAKKIVTKNIKLTENYFSLELV
jgi:hypothetical protein